MATDSTPATTVQNMLNGIDYSALIGGPLQAAISAQVMAAKSSWEFIQQVGLNTDKNTGNKSAVNVTFMYQKDGNMVKLIVPILTIVPIPMIVIDDVSIQFKASLNASSSECTEKSSSESIDAGAEGSARVGWGPFSLQVKAKANYSSKKDSKATSESKYSVEYTQDVSVHAKQADMPAGLATILNILSSAATPNAGANGKIELDKNTIAPTKEAPEVISIAVKDSNGLIVPNSKIKVTTQFGSNPPKGADKANLELLCGHLQNKCNLENGDITLEDGVDSLTFKVDGPIPPAIITLTTEGNAPTITKIKVAQYALPQPANTTPSGGSGSGTGGNPAKP